MKKKSILFLLILVIVSGYANGQLVINEIMYNSDGPDVEFVELINISDSYMNLSGWYILDNNDIHDHCKLSGTLGPGEYLVVAGDLALFNARYTAVTNMNPNYFNPNDTGWSLGNGGDVIRLFDSSGTLHDSVAYNDGGNWPTSPDGNGPSLELLNPYADNSLPTSWDPSSVDDGTPGEVNSVYTENIQPICKNGERSIELPTGSDEVTVTVLAFDHEGLSQVNLFLNTGQGFFNQTMYDNGLNGDEVAGDSIYTTVIPEQISGTLVKYYAVATDNIGQQDSWPNDAPTEYHAYTVDYVPPELQISELLAVNDSVNPDESGEYDDWFEIHNAGSENVNLGGMYVSNSMGSSKSFKLPQVNLAPDEYIIFWADDETEQGVLHVNFKLSSRGEAVALFETVDHGNVLIHGWKYGIMSSNVSMGFNPENGTAPEYLTSPSPGASNESSELFSSVCINEFQATSDFGGPDDWVEIYNRGAESFDLSGCFLSDQRKDNTKWIFPQGSIIDPGEFLVVYEDALDFGFSSEGDDVIMLSAPDSTTGLDFYDFKEQQADKSEGRFPDGVNTWQLFNDPTKGNSNYITSKINDSQNTTPNELILYKNYPNPFNPYTKIKFAINSTQHIKINVYEINGRLVSELVHQNMPAGIHTVHFPADNLSSGVYFYKITAGEVTRVCKMMLLR